MSEERPIGPVRIFCSYSSADRQRVTGLSLLLEALGHRVFVDHKTIKPGLRWEAALQQGLEDADVLLVYWSKHAAQSNWVRREIEWFHTHRSDRSLVPVLADETPLSELLNAFQKSDLFPLVNELIALQREMRSQGSKPSQIQAEIVKRLDEAGIQVEQKDRKKLFALFAASGLAGLISSPMQYFASLANRTYETLAQATVTQGALAGGAGTLGLLLCHLVSNPAADLDQSRTGVATSNIKGQANVPVASTTAVGSRGMDGKEPRAVAGNTRLGPVDVKLTGSGSLVAPGMGNQAYKVIEIDASRFASGIVTISVKLGTGPSSGSFDLFGEHEQIPISGYPNSLAHAYDIAPGGKSTLTYEFDDGQIFQFGATGNWFSQKGATNTFDYQVLVTGTPRM